jgi:hypothetical protein
LHASAVCKNNKAFIITGHGASGKSSTTAYLTKHGYKFLTDDLCSLYINQKGDIVTQLGFTVSKIWTNMAEVLSIDIQQHTKVRPHMEKFFVTHTELPDSNEIPVAALLVLTPKNHQVTTELLPIPPKGLLKHLENNEMLGWSKQIIPRSPSYALLKIQIAQKLSGLSLSRKNTPSSDNLQEIKEAISKL